VKKKEVKINKPSSIVRQHADDWFTFLSQNAFRDIGRIQEIYAIQDPHQIENQGLRSLVLAGHGKAYSLEGNLVAAKTLLDDALEQAEEFGDLDSPSNPDEILAYVNYETGLFWLKVKEQREAVKQFRRAGRLASSENLSRHVAFQRIMLQGRQNRKPDFPRIQSFLEEFQSLKHWIMYVIGMRHTAVLYRLMHEYSMAEEIYQKAMTVAVDQDYTFLLEQLRNSLAYLYLVSEREDEAENIFRTLAPQTQSNFLRSVVLENMALLHHGRMDFHLAVDFCRRALENSQNYSVLAQVPDECLFLGDIHLEQMEDADTAEYYYHLGYQSSLDLAQQGFPLKGVRLEAVEKYSQFLQGQRSIPKTPKAQQPFSDLSGKPWREIVNLFQYNFLVYHQLNAGDRKELLEHLGMKYTTYYAQRNRLEELGFRFPQRSAEQQVPLDNRQFLPNLQNYIQGLTQKDWKNANQHFEEEIMRFLFQRFGYQKSRLARELEVSYPTILAKTKSFTSVADEASLSEGRSKHQITDGE